MFSASKKYLLVLFTVQSGKIYIGGFQRQSLPCHFMLFAASKGYLLVLFTVQSGKSILEAFSDNLSRHFML
ncbi:hypothetical protein OROGR_022964 [Orobanche gracilis]